MPVLSPTLKKMLEGLAYADLAEMLPPSSKDRSLTFNDASGRSAPFSEDADPSGGSTVLPMPRRIGLFLGPYATAAVIEYALESCIRLDAELVVFTFLEDDRARRLIEEHIPAPGEQAPNLHIQHLSGNPERALGALRGRGVRLDFLVCDERGYLGHQLLAGDLALEIPVVMVAPPRERSRSIAPDISAGSLPAKS